MHVQGLDPASRRNLWDVVKSSKEGRAIILTTHSMQEAGAFPVDRVFWCGGTWSERVHARRRRLQQSSLSDSPTAVAAQSCSATG